MKLVVAVIKPFKLQACLQALAAIGVTQVFHSEARGYGRQKGHLSDYQDDRFALAFLPKQRIEFVVAPDAARAAVDAIIAACRTGRQGDGKIWVLATRAPIVDAGPP